MTFIEQDFTNGEVLPASDLDTMDANIDHVREENDYHPLVTAYASGISAAGGAGDLFKVKIDTSIITQDGISSAFSGGSDSDLDISALSEGIHEITLVEYWSLSGSWQTTVKVGPMWFYKTPDMDYLSHKVVWDSANGILNWTVMGHREAKSWS